MILIFLNSKLYIDIKCLSKYKITRKSLGWPTHLKSVIKIEFEKISVLKSFKI